MAYDITLSLEGKWTTERDTYMDESGVEVTHLEAHLRNDALRRDDALVDIYVGEMPEDETAEDQAYANYAETVGFDEDDEEAPIEKFKFNGKNAWGFSALCEDDSPMRFISQEVRKGVLAIIVFAAPDEASLERVGREIEQKLRIK